MKTATITEVKNGLSAVIDRVRAGETVVVTDRGIPVARIEPVSASEEPGARRTRLERAGLIRRGHRRLRLASLGAHRPAVPAGTSAVEAVLADRRESR